MSRGHCRLQEQKARIDLSFVDEWLLSVPRCFVGKHWRRRVDRDGKSAGGVTGGDGRHRTHRLVVFGGVGLSFLVYRFGFDQLNRVIDQLFERDLNW